VRTGAALRAPQRCWRLSGARRGRSRLPPLAPLSSLAATITSPSRATPAHDSAAPGHGNGGGSHGGGGRYPQSCLQQPAYAARHAPTVAAATLGRAVRGVLPRPRLPQARARTVALSIRAPAPLPTPTRAACSCVPATPRPTPSSKRAMRRRLVGFDRRQRAPRIATVCGGMVARTRQCQRPRRLGARGRLVAAGGLLPVAAAGRGHPPRVAAPPADRNGPPPRRRMHGAVSVAAVMAAVTPSVTHWHSRQETTDLRTGARGGTVPVEGVGRAATDGHAALGCMQVSHPRPLEDAGASAASRLDERSLPRCPGCHRRSRRPPQAVRTPASNDQGGCHQRLPAPVAAAALTTSSRARGPATGVSAAGRTRVSRRPQCSAGFLVLTFSQCEQEYQRWKQQPQPTRATEKYHAPTRSLSMLIMFSAFSL